MLVGSLDRQALFINQPSNINILPFHRVSQYLDETVRAAENVIECIGDPIQCVEDNSAVIRVSLLIPYRHDFDPSEGEFSVLSV